MTEFADEVRERIGQNAINRELKTAADAFMKASAVPKYSYNFSWLGRPIIQYPQDIIAMQEIVYDVKPDLIIETGIAHGGSLVFFASMLELNAACGGPKNAEVLGVDIDVRHHNRTAIEAHPMFKRISMIEGSSTASNVVQQVRTKATGRQRVLVCLDSMHTHDHVFAELEAYTPLVSLGSYCVVFDTIIEELPPGTFRGRPWGPGNNPKTAVQEFLKAHPEFQIDRHINHKLLISVAPDGYLRKVA